jgi:fructose-specific phosphotransferase system component IIB
MKTLITLAFASLTLAAGAAPAAKPLEVVFVCQHGYAKSLVAAKHFEAMAAARGLKVHVVARGLTPKDHVPEGIGNALKGDGLPVDGYLPVALAAKDIADADVVVAFGIDLPYPSRATVRRWDDVGALTEDYPKARDQIRGHLGTLLDELAHP